MHLRCILGLFFVVLWIAIVSVLLTLCFCFSLHGAFVFESLYILGASLGVFL